MAAATDLRRLDWRFLLPMPQGGTFRHLVLLGGPRTLTELALKLGVAGRVSHEISTKDPADALVLLEDAAMDLAKASVCLSPGAAVYWEVQRRWTSVFRTTPVAIQQRLFEAKLTPIAIHYARPNFRRVAMYLPIGPRGVLPWYVETLLDAGTLPRKAVRLVLKPLVRGGGAWAYRLLPRFAVTAVAGPPGPRSLATSDWMEWGNAPEAGSAPLILLRGTDSYRRVVVVPFSATARQPAAVVKLWRLPDRNGHSEREQAVLGQIRSRLDSRIARTLPEPLGTVRRGEIVASIESYAPGRSMSHRTAEWGTPLRRKLEDARLVFDWIAEFHRQAQVSRDPWNLAASQRWVEEPCSRYRSSIRLRPDEERLFAALRERSRSLLGIPLPIVWGHPDLTGANIHFSGRQVTVLDWSGATARLPLFDLLYFVVLWSCRVKRPRHPEDRCRIFRRLFLELGPNDPIAGAVREAMARYLKALEIDPRFFPLLLVVNWVIRSVECFERAEAVARGDPGANPHPHESYVEYVRALAEEPERLFRQ